MLILQSNQRMCEKEEKDRHQGNRLHSAFHTIQGQKWESAQFCFKKMLYTFYAMLCYAKSLQSCPTLCDPIDGSPPGFPIPGILQARTLEWVAISFSNTFYRTHWDCIWILCSIPAWLFMVLLNTDTILCLSAHLHPPTEQNQVKSFQPTPRGLERSCHSTQVPKMLIRPQSLDFSMRPPVHRLSLCTCIHCPS